MPVPRRREFVARARLSHHRGKAGLSEPLVQGLHLPPEEGVGLPLGLLESLREDCGDFALHNLFLREVRKINPCIEAAGVSPVPMSARIVQQFVSQETDGEVNPLMPAMGPHVSGVIGSAVVAGVFVSMLG